MTKKELGMIKGPLSRAVKKKAKEAEESKTTEEKDEGETPKEEETGLLRGEVDANRILERILEHPDVPSKVKDDIMLLAEDTSGGIHPQALIGILIGSSAC